MCSCRALGEAKRFPRLLRLLIERVDAEPGDASLPSKLTHVLDDDPALTRVVAVPGCETAMQRGHDSSIAQLAVRYASWVVGDDGAVFY
jgi:hypothetical protein